MKQMITKTVHLNEIISMRHMPLLLKAFAEHCGEGKTRTKLECELNSPILSTNQAHNDDTTGQDELSRGARGVEDWAFAAYSLRCPPGVPSLPPCS